MEEKELFFWMWSIYADLKITANKTYTQLNSVHQPGLKMKQKLASRAGLAERGRQIQSPFPPSASPYNFQGGHTRPGPHPQWPVPPLLGPTSRTVAAPMQTIAIKLLIFVWWGEKKDFFLFSSLAVNQSTAINQPGLTG